jgi:probable phosphoglycerate mutase
MPDPQPLVWVVRHGQTEWSRDGRHTSRTDLDLTPLGREEATALRPALANVAFGLILCSPRRRAARTAELAGLGPVEVTDDLAEWDYGDLEGRTTPDIQTDLPGWSIWTGPWPGGESRADVATRADRLIHRVRASGAANVALVGHGHFSRVIAARWVGEDVAVGRWLDLDTATLSQLGWDRGIPVLKRWNAPVAPTEDQSVGKD